ncbi:neuronal acetylcholine receptor subunit alpha-6-like [Aplysia californica]|uniref:Neuronal acetylcholine receptor subunit alpha-6-like n=1 Tax=Aplysia californica TaxID=6500 RepID=A0ABM0JR32_APLCA|nr:neuronal acetylcholine receptor subunit alpha-6-like [Aplysia californica]
MVWGMIPGDTGVGADSVWDEADTSLSPHIRNSPGKDCDLVDGVNSWNVVCSVVSKPALVGNKDLGDEHTNNIMGSSRSRSFTPTLLFLLVTSFELGTSQTYENAKAIFDDKMSSASYHTERLMWDETLYGGMREIHPQTKNIWKPRVVLLNTLGDRDLFEDDHAPVSVTSDGYVFWAPGSIFPTSCSLDMTNFPFDKQRCFIEMISMGLPSSELIFTNREEEVLQNFYVQNGEWELVNGSLRAGDVIVSSTSLPGIQLQFVLKRRPTFFLLNILLPVVFLSLLNILVFIIPVNSGEKISYGITVLLAVSVFLSIVSSILPRSSDKVPSVTIYLFILLILSSLTVIDSIFIVYLSHQEQEKEKQIKAREKFHSAFNRVKLMQRSVAPMQDRPSLGNMFGFDPKRPASAGSDQRLRPATAENGNAKSKRNSVDPLSCLEEAEESSSDQNDEIH